MVQILDKQTEAQMAPEQTTSRSSQLSGSLLMTLVSWLFLTGSLIFQMDALLELGESWGQGLNLHVVFHLAASLLFTVGSLLFVIQDRQQSRHRI
jgi:hypothetical protein